MSHTQPTLITQPAPLRANPLLVAAVTPLALSRSYTWLLRAVLRRNTRRLMAGDTQPILRTFSDEATLVLDGHHSWSGQHRGKLAIRTFLERFLAEQIRGELHEILVAGPPWRTLISARFTDSAVDATGQTVYENHAMILARIQWGKIVHQHIYEDTQRVAAFDEYLSTRSATNRKQRPATPSGTPNSRCSSQVSAP